MNKVALIGASGFVGTALLNELLSRGHQVTAIVRDLTKITTQSTNLSVVEADATTPAVVDSLGGHDVVISAYNPGWANSDMYEATLRDYPLILKNVKSAGVGRLLIVGGAGTLFVEPNLRLIDSGMLPAEWIPAVKSLGEFYLNTLMSETEIDWVFLSPAANLGNLQTGVRTGKYRVGKDDMLVDANGDSFISVEDYAVAMIDELETPKHHKERFTVAY